MTQFTIRIRVLMAALVASLLIFIICSWALAPAPNPDGWSRSGLRNVIDAELPRGTDARLVRPWLERHVISYHRYEGPLGTKPSSRTAELPAGYGGDISNVMYAFHGGIEEGRTNMPHPLLESGTLEIWFLFDTDNKLVDVEIDEYKHAKWNF